MKIVIDSNILFSSIITPKGIIADILLNPFYNFSKYATNYLFVELFKHQDKILKASELSKNDLLELLHIIISDVTFVSESLIPPDIKKKAYNLVHDIDPKDSTHLALSIFLDSYLWTGDKILYSKLKVKNYKKVINTEELLKIATFI